MFLTNRVPISSLPILGRNDKIDLMHLTPKNRNFILRNEEKNLWWTRRSDKPYVWSTKTRNTHQRTNSSFIDENVTKKLQFPFVRTKSLKKASSSSNTARPDEKIYIIPDTREVQTSYHTSRRRAMSRSALIIPKSQQEIIREQLRSNILTKKERKELTIRPISPYLLRNEEQETEYSYMYEEEEEEMSQEGDKPEKEEDRISEKTEKPDFPKLNLNGKLPKK